MAGAGGRRGVGGPARPRGGSAGGHDREIAGAGGLGQRASRPELRFRRGDVLVRDVHRLFEGIQLRVAEDLPPGAAGEMVARLGPLCQRIRRMSISASVGRGEEDLRMGFFLCIGILRDYIRYPS